MEVGRLDEAVGRRCSLATQVIRLARASRPIFERIDGLDGPSAPGP